MPRPAARRRNAPFSTVLATMCAKGSPTLASPPKVRKTGRTGSAVRESVTIISLIGWAFGAISSQQPNWPSMRQAAVAIAEARPSRSQAPTGAASATVTRRLGLPSLIATAVASPT